MLKLGTIAVINFRIAQFLWNVKPLRLFYYLYYPMWRFFVWTIGVEIYGKTKVGKNLFIAHFGQIFIHPRCIIGDNCIIYNSVSIGTATFEATDNCPIIGNHVRIGAGAKVLGNISIGNNCDIGANAVVLDSFPDNSILAGIPAKLVKTKTNNETTKK